MTASGLGLVLLVAAIAVVVRRAPDLSRAWSSLRSPSAGDLVTMVVTTLLLLPCSGILQRAMLERTSGVRVRVGEMTSLVCLATLLNMLPLWPGAIGRIGYHRVVHGVHPARAGLAVVGARLIGLVVAVGLAAVSWVFVDASLMQLGVAWVATSAVMLGVASVPRYRLAGLAAAAAWIGIGVSAVRYIAAFGLLGVSIGGSTVAAVTGVASVTTSVPMIGSAPGAREWVVGWMTSRLEHIPDALAVGLLADLLVRAATLLVLLPVALVAWRSLKGALLGAAIKRSLDRSPDPEP